MPLTRYCCTATFPASIHALVPPIVETRYIDATSEKDAIEKMRDLGRITYTCETLGPRVQWCDNCHWDRSDIGQQYRLTLSAFGRTVSTVVDPVTRPANEVLSLFISELPITFTVTHADLLWHACPMCHEIDSVARQRPVMKTIVVHG